MRRADRLFEIIQILRSARRALTAHDLGERLEVSKRTVYRDIAALQAMRVPIEGEAGVGYVMRPGYDLPPLNFDIEETEAILVGLRLLVRTGDQHLQRAAARVVAKIDAGADAGALQVVDWGAPAPSVVDTAMLRAAIRDERKLWLRYRDEAERETERVILPIAIVFYVEKVMIAAWCELRGDFRHFRADRALDCAFLDDFFGGRGEALRAEWTARQLAERQALDSGSFSPETA